MDTQYKILVIEDERINQELLKIYLEQAYTLTFATQAEAALQHIESTTFDLIITDIMLGGKLNGHYILEKAKESNLNKQTPIVAYTSSDNSVNQKTFVEEGFDGVISKPLVKTEMTKKINTLINRKQIPRK